MKVDSYILWNMKNKDNKELKEVIGWRIDKYLKEKEMIDFKEYTKKKKNMKKNGILKN